MLTHVADRIMYHLVVFSSSVEAMTKCVFQLQKLRLKGMCTRLA